MFEPQIVESNNANVQGLSTLAEAPSSNQSKESIFELPHQPKEVLKPKIWSRRHISKDQHF